jgi:hypothetical protein
MVLKSPYHEVNRIYSSSSEEEYEEKRFRNEEMSKILTKLEAVNSFIQRKSVDIGKRVPQTTHIYGEEYLPNDSKEQNWDESDADSEDEDSNNEDNNEEETKIKAQEIEEIMPSNQFSTVEGYDPERLYNRISNDMNEEENYRNRYEKKRQEYKSSLFSSFFALIRIKLFGVRRKVEPIEVIDANIPKSLSAFNESNEKINCFNSWIPLTRSKTM